MRFSIRNLFVIIFLATPLLTLFSDQAVAQQNQEHFDRALEMYQEGRFLDAAKKFSEINIPEAQLFAGKSYFASGYYKLAGHYLGRVPSNAASEIYDDSRYTLALSDFQTNNFGRSLDRQEKKKNNTFSSSCE